MKHPTLGKKRPDAAKRMSNHNNPMWTGNNIRSIVALHAWIRRHKTKPLVCEMCNEKESYDLVNISPTYNPSTYNRNPENWRWYCRRCHMISDGRMNNLKQYGGGHSGK
jgi:hypothetical protein